MTEVFTQHQVLLWIITVFADLGFAVLCYRLFGRTGLYGVIIFSLILANIMGPKLTVIGGLQTSMGVILYSSIFFATDLLSEKYGKAEAQRAVMLGFFVSIALVVMTQISMLFVPSSFPQTSAFAQSVHAATGRGIEIHILGSKADIHLGSCLVCRYRVSQHVDFTLVGQDKTHDDPHRG